jgi:predicted nucleic acid-binding protein
LVGLLDPRDIWRSQAEAILNALLGAGITPVYFDCVAAEAVSAAARCLRERGCAAEVSTLLDRLTECVPHESLTWILADVPVFCTSVLAIMRASSGKLNFNDGLIALACRERNIPSIASFDADFDKVDWLRRIAGPRISPWVISRARAGLPVIDSFEKSGNPASD